ncbi:MAG: 8-amino-7-oxononanoate synthase [Gemmataceae bacterium]
MMLAWIDDEISRLRQQGLYRTRRRLESGQGAELRWNKCDYVNFSSNDYLGYATDERLAHAACRAARRYGSGAGASPLVSGYHPVLQRLERDLARWEGTEAALVFASGYLTNLAVISALGKGGVLFSDALNHASLIDGCRLARGTLHIYRHNDLAHLEELLRSHPGPRRLIISDSVFSMDGDLADVPALAELARRHEALLILDEAHATGVLGSHGRGLSDTLAGPQPYVVKLGTLSKALAAQGGFVCATGPIIDLLINTARPYLFATALAPTAAAAARRAIFLVQQEPQRREQVLMLADLLRSHLRELGYDVGCSASPIVPVIVGTPEAALALQNRLAAQRLLVPAIRPPSVPVGTSRLRISLSAAHTLEDVDRLVAALHEARSGLEGL